MKEILSQHDCMRVRGTWVSKIQEYDLEINPTKLIKGQGLAKMLTQKNEEAIEMIAENNAPQPAMTLALQELDNHWYSDIIFFLLHLTYLDHLKGHKRRALRLKTARYCLTQEGLGWRCCPPISTRWQLHVHKDVHDCTLENLRIFHFYRAIAPL